MGNTCHGITRYKKNLIIDINRIPQLKNIHRNKSVDYKKLQQEKNYFQLFNQIIKQYKFYSKIFELRFINLSTITILTKVEKILDFLKNNCINNFDKIINITLKAKYLSYEEFHTLSDYVKTLNKNNINNIQTQNLKKKNENPRKKSVISSNFYSNCTSVKKYVKMRMNEILSEMFEQMVIYDKTKVHKLLIKCPPNNLRWFIWSAIARNKYLTFSKDNESIYYSLSKNINVDITDGLMFEIHNTLTDTKIFYNEWSTVLYRIIKSLCLYDEKLVFKRGINTLIGLPLIISDCDENGTFLFSRFLFSPYFGLGLRHFFTDDELKLTFIVFLFNKSLEMKYHNIYEYIQKLNLLPEEWIKKWIKHLYCNVFCLGFVIRLWDCIISLGLRFIINYSLAILKYFSDRFMKYKTKDKFIYFFEVELKSELKERREILFHRENVIDLALNIIIPEARIKKWEQLFLEELDKLNLYKLSENNSSNKKISRDEREFILSSLLYVSLEDRLRSEEYNKIFEEENQSNGKGELNRSRKVPDYLKNVSYYNSSSSKNSEKSKNSVDIHQLNGLISDRNYNNQDFNNNENKNENNNENIIEKTSENKDKNKSESSFESESEKDESDSEKNKKNNNENNIENKNEKNTGNNIININDEYKNMFVIKDDDSVDFCDIIDDEEDENKNKTEKEEQKDNDNEETKDVMDYSSFHEEQMPGSVKISD